MIFTLNVMIKKVTLPKKLNIEIIYFLDSLEWNNR